MLIKKLAFTGVIAALSFAVFTFIRIPMPGNTSAVHLGNAVVVLGALLLGGFYGGIGGALGMVIADIMVGWAPYAPLTLVLKTCIGLMTGLFAHRIGKLNEQNDQKKVLKWTFLAASAGLGMNMVLAPLIGYFYNILIIGKRAADTVIAWNILASSINAFVSLIVSVVVYMALRPALKKSGFLYS